ncbi:MAG: hypothetical protein ACRC7N_05150 [Clostridium sp.]
MKKRIFTLTLCIIIIFEGGVIFSKNYRTQQKKEELPVTQKESTKKVDGAEVIREITTFNGNISTVERKGDRWILQVNMISNKSGIEEFLSKIVDYNIIEYELSYLDNTYILNLQLEIR